MGTFLMWSRGDIFIVVQHRKLEFVPELEQSNKPRGKSNSYTGFEAVVPGVTLPSSKLKGKIASWGSSVNGHGNQGYCNRSRAGDQKGECVNGGFMW